MNARIIVTTALLAAASFSTAIAADPTTKCESGKLKEAGKYLSCRMKAEAKAATKGEAADYTKCESKFAAKWAKVEEKAGPGICPSEGNLTEINDRIVAETAALAVRIAGMKTVFLTSGSTDGDFGGLIGADDICQQAAADAGLPGNYMAWLSDGIDAPATRFTQSVGPYVLVDGTTIAADWDDLVDGTLAAPISITEFGADLGFEVVWTNVVADGTSGTEADCSSYTSDSFFSLGSVGHSNQTDGDWSFASQTSCSSTARLYCFEQ